MSFEETVEQFCDNYCKYPLTCADEDALAEKCDACPICKLAEQLEAKEQERPITNFDRVKSMSVEELAEFLNDMQNDALFLEGTINDLKYPTDWMEYLESEV